MRCRHCNAVWTSEWEYCPECHRNFGGATYPEKQTAQERADVDRLTAMIANAFRGVQIQDGVTIHEADLEGAYTDDCVRIAAREKDNEKYWMDVPGWKVERLSFALSFLDPKGWRFYIPAYMTWALKNWRTSDSQTVDSVIHDFEQCGEYGSMDRRAILTAKQAEAVYEFLRFFCEYSGDTAARRAIHVYWHQFASTTE